MNDLILSLYLAGVSATISSLLTVCIWAILAGMLRVAALPTFGMWVAGYSMTVMLVIFGTLLFVPMSNVIFAHKLEIYALGVSCVFGVLGTIGGALLCSGDKNETK